MTMQMEGKKLGGRYEIVSRVGGGGMAVVYKAKDVLLNRYVAIKVLSESLSNDSEFIRRFSREAQAAASLSHPNIVNVYDVGRDHFTHYIVMELVEGPTLKQYIQERGYFALGEDLRSRIAGEMQGATAGSNGSALAEHGTHGVVDGGEKHANSARGFWDVV